MLASPCGMCREMISDYGPNSMVIVQTDNGPETVPISELLPLKFRNPTRK
jgi:cytidine deaminase